MRTLSRLFRSACLAAAVVGAAAGTAPALDTSYRVYFGDAKISFVTPGNWMLNREFPYGPLFSKTTQSGFTAAITCAISAPLSENRLTYDISMDILRSMAEKQLAASHPEAQEIVKKERALLGRNAYEIDYTEKDGPQAVRIQSVYLYLENRVYAFSLRSDPPGARWLSPVFQSWLDSLRVLSREDTGALDTPSHGARYLHQTGGLIVDFPDGWLVGAADDRMVGATTLQAGGRGDLVLTLDVRKDASIKKKDRKELEKTNKAKGRTILSHRDVVVGGRPALALEYEGSRGTQTVRGRDVLIAAPRALVLINFETDAGLFTKLAPVLDSILETLRWI